MRQIYNLTITIKRFDPDKNTTWNQEYSVEAGRIMRFVDILRKINETIDPTLVWASSCEHGQCGTCSMKINGKPMLSCELLVENAVEQFKTTEFYIEPLTIAPTVRDLVINSDHAYARVDEAKPYVIKPKRQEDEGEENQIKPELIESYVNATRCINCFCCATACISGSNNFLGPNAMLAAIVRAMDSREQEKGARLECIYSDKGVYRCHSSQSCSFVCPKEIDVAGFIAMAKRGDI